LAAFQYSFKVSKYMNLAHLFIVWVDVQEEPKWVGNLNSNRIRKP